MKKKSRTVCETMEELYFSASYYGATIFSMWPEVRISGNVMKKSFANYTFYQSL